MYGSLQFPDVLRVLIGRVPDMVPAMAAGWRVTALADVDYPGLVSGDDSAVGHLLADLSWEEWKILDAFENPLYDLTFLATSAADAWAYTCPATSTAPIAGGWTMGNFADRHLAEYLVRCARWLSAYEERTRSV